MFSSYRVSGYVPQYHLLFCIDWLHAQLSRNKHSQRAYNFYHLFDMHFHV